MRCLAALVLSALMLTGCESNIERSARLAKSVRHVRVAQTGLVIARENPDVKVLARTVLRDAGATAAVVTLRDDSSAPLRDVPLAIALRDSRGKTLYQNNAPGLSAALVSVPLLVPGQQFDWVDDQVQASGPGNLSVKVGESPSARVALPRLSVEHVHLSEESGGEQSAEGAVVNHSSVPQQELVVFAVAKRRGEIVAAGRAVLPSVPAHSSTSFQVFFIGDPKGAALQLSAPPTTLG